MRNLVSVGGPQQGIFGVPKCPAGGGYLCRYVGKLLSRGVYNEKVQQHVVPAQYWQNPNDREEFIEKSAFLAEINNEQRYNESYRTNLMSLQNLVLIKFERETFNHPAETEWFGFFADGQDKEVVSMNETMVYKSDLLGLKDMKDEGKLHLLSSDTDHLDLSDEFMEKKVIPFLK